MQGTVAEQRSPLLKTLTKYRSFFPDVEARRRKDEVSGGLTFMRLACLDLSICN